MKESLVRTRAYEAQRPAALTCFWNRAVVQNQVCDQLWTGLNRIFYRPSVVVFMNVIEEHTSNKNEVTNTLNWLLRLSAVLFMRCHGGTHLEQN